MTFEAVQTGRPKFVGRCIAYVRCDNPEIPVPDTILLQHFDGKWYYPRSLQQYEGEVLGWIGPIPLPGLSELEL